MKIHQSLITICAAIGLVACGSGNNSNQTTTTQQHNTQYKSPQWESCTSNKYPSMDPNLVNYFESRLQCAQIAVPLDYKNPTKGTINIAISRVKATDQQHRIGIMLMNPGGPGGSGLGFATMFDMLYDSANSGTDLHRLSEVYDFIGFDPRGVGSSTNLVCQLNTYYHPEMLVTQDLTTDNLNNIYYNQQLDANACATSSLTPYINTTNTANDMDVIRQSLGESQLNYYGYSYGTWLGTWYASTYPEHVNHMVLDSTVDFTKSLVQNNQAVPMQFVLDNIITPYAAQNNESFGLGTDESAIRGLFGTFNLSLQTAFSNLVYDYMFNQKSANTVVEYLMAAKQIQTILTNNPDTDSTVLIENVSNFVYSTDNNINSKTQAIASGLAQAYLDIANKTPVPVIMQNESLGSSMLNNAVNKAVSCNDEPTPTDQSFWNNYFQSLKSLAPVYFHDRAELNCTTNWLWAGNNKPNTANASKIPSILMMQDQYDAATPAAGAFNTYKALASASMVYVSGVYSHGVFPSNNTFIDNAVTNYLLGDVNSMRGSKTFTQLAGNGLISNINDPSPVTLPSSSNIQSNSLQTANISITTQGKPYFDKSFANPDHANKIVSDIMRQISPK